MDEDVSQWSGTHFSLRRVSQAPFVFKFVEKGRYDRADQSGRKQSRLVIKTVVCLVCTQHAAGVIV
jgi:hypothetical protein